MSGELVLVTGGAGFLGAHCIIALRKAGYRVRTTVRSVQSESKVRALLKMGGIPSPDDVTCVVADLTADAGWSEAAAGCTFVLHVASPFVLAKPKNEDDLMIPAREGTLRVLRFARDAGVRRVVLTSSSEAVIHGTKPLDHPYSEVNWSDTSSVMTVYGKSKTLAERAAWDFMARESGALELSVVNPVGIYGPVLGPDLSASIEIVAQMMKGAMPRLPHLTIDVVDVRDVADLHLRAMIDPGAKGERFLAAATGHTSLPEIAILLKTRMGDAATKVSTKTVPDWVVRMASLVVPQLRQVVPYLGHLRSITNAKALRVLGWNPRSCEEAVLATAESLVRLGLIQRQ
jgi:nucleoside-diphosphate-sugar epimerase